MAMLACPPGIVVAQVRLYALRLPLRRPMHMAGSVIRETANLLVHLTASDGSEGWGEAASAPTMTGETLPGMQAAASLLAALVVGCPLAELDEVQRRMGLALYGNASVKSAFETAWLDAVGRATGQPVAALLGTEAQGVPAKTFDLQWMLGSGTAEADVAEAGERRAAGFRVFKLKVGGDPQADAQRTLAVAARLGADCLLSADANQGWSTAAALAYAEAVGPGVLAFLEQPVADDLMAMAAVARGAPMPIGSDEGIHSLRDIERHDLCAAAAGVGLKPIKLGGLRATVAAARRCAELGMQVNLACKVAESGISAAALLHAAAASPAVDWGMSLTHQYLLHDLVAPMPVEGGRAGVPAGAGLGIAIDAEMLKAYATPLPA